MIWFKLWDPVYYRNWTNKAGKVLIHPGRFLGFAWNAGDPMTFKTLQCNEDPRKQNIILHRGVVIPRSPTAIGYNSDLAPKNAAYFPYVKVEGGATSKTVPLGHQGTVYPPNISIPEGEVKRSKISSSSPNVWSRNNPP